MKKARATGRVCNLIIAAVCIVFLAGCSNVPVFKKHNISELGAISELEIRVRKPIFLGYIKTYEIKIAISRNVNQDWYDSCMKPNGNGICKLPATFRVQVTNDTTNMLVTSVTSQGIKSGNRGDEVFFSLLRVDLDPGNYTITVENLTYETRLQDPSGNVRVDFGNK